MGLTFPRPFFLCRCHLILFLGRKLMGKTYLQDEGSMRCCLYFSIQNSTHPWHGNNSCPSRLPEMIWPHRSDVPEDSPSPLNVNYSGMGGSKLYISVFFFLADLSKKFVNKYFLIQRKIRGNEYDSVSSDGNGKIFWYWVPDIFWKWLLLMPDQMFPEIKFGSLSLM